MGNNILVSKGNHWTINFDFGCDCNMSGMAETEVIAMYHTLAKICNKTFRTNFKYSEEEISRCGNYEHKGFRFVIQKSNYEDIYSIFSQDNDSILDYRAYWTRYIPKETIISFVELLADWLSINDIHYLTYLTYKPQWLFHIGIGIGTKLDTFYKDCYENDIDFSKESITLLKQIKGKELLEKWSENAITIQETPNSYIKASIDNNRIIKFYYYNKPHSYCISYNLDMIAENTLLLNELKKKVNTDVIDKWVADGCSPFLPFNIMDLFSTWKYATDIRQLDR